MENGDGEGAILARIGEAAYRWSIGDDRIAWSRHAADLFGLASDAPIASGRDYAVLLDPSNLTTRHDAVLNGVGVDQGSGVAYQIEYAILPSGADGPRFWIEDTGRWYADGGRRPARAEGVVRIVNDRQQREQRLAYLSRYDELTGFFNRAHLLDILDDTLASVSRFRSSAAFLLVAIDNFRAINETYGLPAGDRIFAAVARRIKERLRDGDAIGRYSGGKLGLVLMNCDEGDMRVAAARFIAAVQDAVIATDGVAVAASISIGGLTLPRYARNRGEAVVRAREALDAARRLGSGRFGPYAPSPEREAARRENAVLSRELAGALADGRLRLAFQPVVDLASRAVVFHEALLRLEQADGAIASAASVVPVAERLGLSRLVDIRALDLVIEALAAHPAARLSVNLSADTAAGLDWLATLKGAVAQRADIGPRLTVEITESSAVRNIDETARFVAALHDLGARVAIDDFGAGFTSFQALRVLPIDIVKIDGTYVRNLATSRQDQIFVRRLVEIARDLGIETVAEWVENEEAAAVLAGWGVDRIQGHLVGAASLDVPWIAS